MKVLFILKKNETYGFETYTRRSSGLYNSTRFITESLNRRRIHSHIIEVIDNNDIDRNVTKYKPEVVVLEALWVVPEKFDELKKLHPHIKWMIHMHSGLPFLALEGIAMGWLRGYTDRGIQIIANSKETYDAFRAFLPHRLISYLPNVYVSHPMKPLFRDSREKEIHIGSFGAVRPMKNQLHQAIAAIAFAKELGKHLYFYINASRIETGGDPVLKNLTQLFEGQMNCTLIQNKWCEPEEFLTLLHDTIDLGMQVSLTETFNVVSADYVTAGVPIVVSDQVKWASKMNVAESDSIEDTVRIMRKVYRSSYLVKWNQFLLLMNGEKAIRAWSKFFTERF